MTAFGNGTPITADALNRAFASVLSPSAASLTGTTLASNVIYSSLTSVGTITSGTWSGSFGAVSGANLTNLNASNLASGTVPSARLSGAYTGITGLGTLTSQLSVSADVYMTGQPYINNSSPTVYFQDTDHRSAMIHVNSNQFYVLRGSGTNSTTWSAYGGYWPLVINLENNDATFGGSAVINGSLTISSTLYGPGTNTALFYTSTADSALPWSTGPVLQGQTGWAFYSVVNGSYRMGYRNTSNGVTNYAWINDSIMIGTAPDDSKNYNTLNVIGGSAFFSAMSAGSGATVVNNFGTIQYVSSRRELKDNIVSVDTSVALERIRALRPVEFTMRPEFVMNPNDLTALDKKRGFIAQEVADVDHWYGQWGWVDEEQKMLTEEALDGGLDLQEATPIYWNHDAVIADLVAAVQNISSRVDALEG